MHHANEKRRKEKKCPRAGVYSDKGRLPGSTFFPAREELVGVLLSENPSIHHDIYIHQHTYKAHPKHYGTQVYNNIYNIHQKRLLIN